MRGIAFLRRAGYSGSGLEAKEVVLERSERRAVDPSASQPWPSAKESFAATWNRSTRPRQSPEQVESTERFRKANTMSRKRSYTNLTQAGRVNLPGLRSGVGAEIAVQLRKNAEAELIENTRAWAVKRFARYCWPTRLSSTAVSKNSLC